MRSLNHDSKQWKKSFSLRNHERNITMKTKLTLVKWAALLTLLSTFNSQLSTVHAQSTVFTYQGRVTDNGTNFNGSGQFQFALVTSTNASYAATATITMGGTSDNGFVSSITLANGGYGYTVAPQVTFSGAGGSGAQATTTISGGVVTSITLVNAGSGYSGVPVVTIATPPVSIAYTTYWSNDGTSVNGSEPTGVVNVAVADGLFTVTLGDTNTVNMAGMDSSLFGQPDLQLRIWFNDGVHGFAALSPLQNLTPAPYATYASIAAGLPGLTVQNISFSPNLIGGVAGNYVASGVAGATIGGGGEWAFANGVTAHFGTVSGGFGNTASGEGSTIGGGFGNTASGEDSTIGGGDENNAGGKDAIVAGGFENTASGDYSTIGGGFGNTASGREATVSGGYGNFAGGNYSFAAGANAQAINDGAFVWNDSTGSNFSSTANNQFAVRAAG